MEKKQAVSDADLQLKKYERDMQALKEKTATVNFVANLEKQYDWILNENEYVLLSLFCFEINVLIYLLGCLGRRGHGLISRPLILAN
jgi:hypothetical protein